MPGNLDISREDLLTSQRQVFSRPGAHHLTIYLVYISFHFFNIFISPLTILHVCNVFFLCSPSSILLFDPPTFSGSLLPSKFPFYVPFHKTYYIFVRFSPVSTDSGLFTGAQGNVLVDIALQKK